MLLALDALGDDSHLALVDLVELGLVLLRADLALGGDWLLVRTSEEVSRDSLMDPIANSSS